MPAPVGQIGRRSRSGASAHVPDTRILCEAFHHAPNTGKPGPSRAGWSRDSPTPVERLHRQIDDAKPGLQQLLPDYVAYLPAVHEVVQEAAAALRAAPAAFDHDDINIWNVLIMPEQAVLIDWDHPRVADPAMEIALLDKHASLFNKTGLSDAFFTGYGQLPVEPNTSMHRLVQTLEWATSSDWAEFEADPTLPSDLVHRARGWLPVLVDYLRELPAHLDRLRTLTATPR